MLRKNALKCCRSEDACMVGLMMSFELSSSSLHYGLCLCKYSNLLRRTHRFSYYRHHSSNSLRACLNRYSKPDRLPITMSPSVAGRSVFVFAGQVGEHPPSVEVVLQGEVVHALLVATPAPVSHFHQHGIAAHFGQAPDTEHGHL